MKQKIIGIISLMTVMLFAMATAAWAGDFKIQYPVGTDIFTIDTSGNANASGEIYENNTLLSDVYWQIASVATPSDGDTTSLSTADQIYDFVIGQGYTTTAWDDLANITLTENYIFVGNSSNTPHGVAMSGHATITSAGVISVVNTAGLDASNITAGTIDNARITLVEDEIPQITSAWANDMDADQLIGVDALNYQILIDGANVSAGTVVDARIDAAIARDAEVLTWVGTTWGFWNESTDVGLDEINESSIKMNSTCAAGSHLYISGTDFACETDDDTTYTVTTPLNMTGTLIDLIACADTEIYKYNTTAGDWECEADGGGMDDLIDDTTPQLGGNLDVNDFGIDGGGSTNMTIDGSGNFIIVLA